MNDTVEQTIKTVAEKVTNTTTPEASAGVLLEWIIGAFRAALASPTPLQSVQDHVAALDGHKETLAAAVAATPN